MQADGYDEGTKRFSRLRAGQNTQLLEGLSLFVRKIIQMT